MNKELARELIGAGVHFGHTASRWNPKMKPYIFGKRGMIHIINVKETLKGLVISKRLLSNVVSSGRDVVFVGTKRQAKKGVQLASKKCGMHYVSERWLGGMLTNFRTIRSRLQRLEELEGMEANGSIEAQGKKQGSLGHWLKRDDSNEYVPAAEKHQSPSLPVEPSFCPQKSRWQAGPAEFQSP